MLQCKSMEEISKNHKDKIKTTSFPAFKLQEIFTKRAIPRKIFCPAGP